MNYLRKLVFAALVLCALAQWTHAQTLLLYPAVSLMEAMVYNNDLGELRNVQGAFPWFVCSSRNSTISGTELLPCASNLTLYTKLDETLLTMNFVSDEGRPRPFVPDDVEVVIGGEKWKAEFKQIGTAEFDIPLKFQSDTRPITVIAQEENETRQLNLVHDSTPPVLTVETLTPVVNTDERIPKARFAVQFSEDVIPVPKTGVFCNATLPGLLNNVSVGDLLNASMACPSGGELDFKGTFSVRGADKVSATFLVKNRRILIVATAKAGVPADIRLTVFKKVFIDFAGNVNEQGGSAQARYRPTVGIATSDIGARIARRTIVLSDDEVVVEEELEMPPDVSSAKAFGTASSAMVAAAAATSMAGGAAGGGGAGGGGGGGGALNILGLAQKMFMTGLVAIKNFPENYAAFVGELAWTVFDVDLPWEDDDNTTRTVTPFGIEREEEGEEEEFEGLESLLEADDDEDPKKHLLQVLMWISIAFLLVIVLHALLLSCCLCRRRPVPWLLAVPRLEIMLAFWAVPAITIAVAGLYKGDLGDALLATWLVILIPTSFLAWNFYMIWTYFYSKPTGKRKANLILDDEVFPDHNIKVLVTGTVKAAKKNVTKQATTVKRGLTRAATLPRGMTRGMRRMRSGNSRSAVSTSLGPITEDTEELDAAFNDTSLADGLPPIEDDDAAGDGDECCPEQGATDGVSDNSDSSEYDPFREAISPRLKAESPISRELLMSLSPRPPEEEEEVVEEPEDVEQPIEQPPAEESESDCPGLRECCCGMCERCFITPLLGGPQQSCTWVATSKQDSRFIHRYGVLFEDNRGHPVMRSGATYTKDENTGKIDRGKLIPIKGKPLLTIPQFRVPRRSAPARPLVLYRYQLQILTRPLDYLKIILLGCLIGGVDSENSLAQVIALFCISFLSLIIIRISRPFPSRADMAVTLLAEAADVITFALGIALLVGPNEDRDFRIRIGSGMLFVEGAALLATLAENLLLGLGICGWLRGEYKEKYTKPPEFVAVVQKAMLRDSRRLEKKYFERWMVKVLRKGLHNRPLKAEERSWRENLIYSWGQLMGDVGKGTKGVKTLSKKVSGNSRSHLISTENARAGDGQNGANGGAFGVVQRI